MNVRRPRFPYTSGLLGLVLILAVPLAARTLVRVFNAPADKVYEAAVKAAQTDARMSILSESADQRRLHVRVQADNTDLRNSPIGRPPHEAPDSASSAARQPGEVMLTIVVTPAGPMQSSVTVESQNVITGFSIGSYPGQGTSNTRNAREFQERQAACMLLLRMRSILKLPAGRVANSVKISDCE
ncbi:MAG TPA: hypothetical protein VD837_07470 [Terriglobales bacterium]|nr:hypothetical protein [Terriglobales bacterium]